MQWLRLVPAAVALAAPAVAANEFPTIRLAPGEAVTLRFDDGGPVGEPIRATAEWTRFDVFAARELTGMAPPDSPVPVGSPMTAPGDLKPDPIPGDEVRIRLMSIADRHTLLVVENGQGRGLRYRARMTVEGRTKPTDVCIVLAGLPSYEHWPHRIERLELFDFEFVTWPASRPPTCE